MENPVPSPLEENSRIGIVTSAPLLTIFDSHNIQDAHFLGSQEGALIAQAFGHIYPARIKSLTAIGSYSIYDNDDKKIEKERFIRKFKLGFFLAL